LLALDALPAAGAGAGACANATGTNAPTAVESDPARIQAEIFFLFVSLLFLHLDASFQSERLHRMCHRGGLNLVAAKARVSRGVHRLVRRSRRIKSG
jgi:hypothetical protein